MNNFGDATAASFRLIPSGGSTARTDVETPVSAQLCRTQTANDTLLVSLYWEKGGVLEPAMRNYKNISPNYTRFACCYFSDRLLFTERRASV
jgi:hypothetical protein